MWGKSTVDSDRKQMPLWRMRIACWITETTDTHSECVIFAAFHSNNGYTCSSHCYVTVHWLSCLKSSMFLAMRQIIISSYMFTNNCTITWYNDKQHVAKCSYMFRSFSAIFKEVFNKANIVMVTNITDVQNRTRSHLYY
jgi:hypothetical protein